MAIAMVGSAGLATSTSTSLVSVFGQATTAGNMLCIGVVAVLNNAAPTVSTPAGWTACAGNTTAANGINNIGLFWFWKIAAGGDTAPTFTIGSSATTSKCCAVELSGADGTTPHVVDGTFGSAAATPCSSGVITTTVANEFILSLGGERTASSPTLTWGGGSSTLVATAFTTPCSITIGAQTVPTSGTAVTVSMGFTAGAIAMVGSMGFAPAGAISASGSVSLTGSGIAQATAAAAGGISLSGSGSAQVSATATAAVSLAGAGAAQASAAASASLTLAGSATSSASAAGTASVTLTAAAAAFARTSGLASITLTATAVGRAKSSGLASIVLIGSGNIVRPRVTPPDRIITIRREVRMVRVPPDAPRLLTVPAEARVHQVTVQEETP